MEHDNSVAVLAAFDWGRKGGTAESCMTCRKLLDAAHQIVEMGIRRKRDHMMGTEPEWQGEPVAKLGRLADILSDPSCEAHKGFVRSAFLMNKDDPLTPPWAPEETFTVEVLWDANKGLAVLCHHGPDGEYHADTMLLDNESDNSGLACIGRSRDNEFIDIDLMSKWISTCDQLHTSTCNVPTSPSTSLSWMIDTISGCLVPAGECTRYVALSYVWGQTEMLKTTTETLSAMKEAGALHADTKWKIPPVIRHAIALVPKLGERYLWVDSLCIKQDDAESLARHIRHMVSIYEAALFTIVAADGADANHGIPGLRGVSTARKLPASLPLTPRLRLRPRCWINIFHSPWGGRGWTLQEYVFSRKKLVFVHGSVQWICQERRCFEDICQESPLVPKKATVKWDPESQLELESVGELAVQYPMISQVEGLLSRYTSRQLTHQHDVLNAVDAVFTAHHGAFPHGFFWGLPVDYLDIALLWTSLFHATKRQQASPYPSHSRFPRWTWAGWIGTLSGKQWSAATYIKNADERKWMGINKCQTIPICEWHQRVNRGSSERLIQGQNRAYTYKQRFMGKQDGLPHGWKYERELFGPDPSYWHAYYAWKHEHETLKPGAPYDSGHDLWKAETFRGRDWALATPYYYSHEAAPGVKFWHPVPISPDPLSNTTTVPAHGGLLCAKARSGSLWAVSAEDHPAARPDSRPNDFTGHRYVDLFSGEIQVETVFANQKGDLVGYLDIDDQSDHDLIKTYEHPPDMPGYPCELVAISKGNDFVHPMEPDKEVYTFYNVLWVKWEDGIAYRRGVGRVKRETWESMELENVDLVLG